MDAIHLQHVHKSVPAGFWGAQKELLHDVSFAIEQGTTVGFIGANGAGKSTTIKHIIGACKPTSGKVTVLGADPRSTAVRRRFGYMPELPTLPPTLTPREVIRLHGVLCGVTNLSKRTEELLALVDLGEDSDRALGGFSKGMQTRLCLALALVHDPELFILDEPMSGLDPVGRQLVRTILTDLAARGRTVFFSSHVLADVEALCDHTAVMRAGRLVAFGPTSAAVGAPARFRLRVRTKDALAPTGCLEARKEGDTWLVVVAHNDPIEAALQLRSAGATVLSVEPLRPSLEERTAALLGPAS